MTSRVGRLRRQPSLSAGPRPDRSPGRGRGSSMRRDDRLGVGRCGSGEAATDSPAVVMARTSRRPKADAWRAADASVGRGVPRSSALAIAARARCERRRCRRSSGRGSRPCPASGDTRTDHREWHEQHPPAAPTFCSHLAMRGAPARAIRSSRGIRIWERRNGMHLSPAALDGAIRLLEARILGRRVEK